MEKEEEEEEEEEEKAHGCLEYCSRFARGRESPKARRPCEGDGGTCKSGGESVALQDRQKVVVIVMVVEVVLYMELICRCEYVRHRQKNRREREREEGKSNGVGGDVSMLF